MLEIPFFCLQRTHLSFVRRSDSRRPRLPTIQDFRVEKSQKFFRDNSIGKSACLLNRKFRVRFSVPEPNLFFNFLAVGSQVRLRRRSFKPYIVGSNPTRSTNFVQTGRKLNRQRAVSLSPILAADYRRGCRFESCRPDLSLLRNVAQLAKHTTDNRARMSSILSVATKSYGEC